MKTKILAILLLAAFAAVSQNPVLHWKFENAHVGYNGTDYVLEFDIMAGCDSTGTQPENMRVYFNYNNLAFGINIAANNNITVEKGVFLIGNPPPGYELYQLFGPFDNNPNRVGIVMERATIGYYWHFLPSLPAYGHMLHIEMVIQDKNQLAGIEFVGEEGGINYMNAVQTFSTMANPFPYEKYGNPPEYQGIYENDLLQFSLNNFLPVLHWRFANPAFVNDSVVFDVELRCSLPGTFHSSTQVYFDYNTDVFGECIASNNTISLEKLELLQGNVAGSEKYSIVNYANSSPDRFCVVVEAGFVVANPMFMNEVTTDWKGYMRFKIAIVNPDNYLGIQFVQTIMNAGQYYVDINTPTETKYGYPSTYKAFYENSLYYVENFLSGTVSEAGTGYPIPMARIIAGDDTTQTNPDGEYFLETGYGIYDVNCSADGFIGQTMWGVLINPDDTTLLDFQLAPISSGAMAGFVLDDISQQAIPNATVTLGLNSINSGPDGSYIISGINAGAYDVIGSHPGYIPDHQEWICIYPDDTTQLDLNLFPYNPPDSTLYWKFTNYYILNDSLHFDVEVKCSHPGTFHNMTKLCFNYDTTLFGSSIAANNNISFDRLELLEGDLSGTPLYNIINYTDITPSCFGIMAEAGFIIPDPSFMNEVDTALSGYMRFRIVYNGSSPNSPDIILFTEDLMNGYQNYVSQNGGGTYGSPPDYKCGYINKITDLGCTEGLFGYVKDAVTGLGIEDAVVSDGFGQFVLTNEDGLYSMCTTCGTNLITASTPYYDTVTHYVYIIGGQNSYQDFELNLFSGSIDGTITNCDTGEGIEGVEITTGTYTTTTDTTGNFILGEVIPGNHEVTIAPTGYQNSPVIINIEVLTGQATTIDTCLIPLPPVELQYNSYCDTVELFWNDPAPGLTIGYYIYIDGQFIESVNNTSVMYFEQFGEHEYCVTALYPEGESLGTCDSIQSCFCNPPENLYTTHNHVSYQVPLFWEPPSPQGDWVTWCDFTNAGGNGIGLTTTGSFYLASRWEPSDLAQYNGQYLRKIMFWWNDDAPEAIFKVMVWEGSDASTLLYEQEVVDAQIGDWNEVILDSAAQIDVTQELWFGYEVTHNAGTHPAGTDLGPAIEEKGDMISLDGITWESMSISYALDYNWALQGYISQEGTATTVLQPKEKHKIEIDRSLIRLTSRLNENFVPKSTSSIKGECLIEYNIYRDINYTNNWELVGTTAASLTEFFDWAPSWAMEAEYYVEAVYSNGVSLPSNEIWTYWWESVDETSITNLKIFPNPAKDFLKIESDRFMQNITLLNSQGVTVYSKEGINEFTFQINTSSFPSGLYYLRVETEEGIVNRKILIIK
ncbi:MAG: T9SS type A sorting domain-containing protein [Bacteroidales bacterium]|nr:T9SS type A sorting domain-containing protein [Bacteroidales bacterium]